MIWALALIAFAREGARFVLQTKDGRIINGELLAIKYRCLILKDDSGAGVTQDIDDVAILSIRRGSHWLAGLVSGLAIGTVMGVAIGNAAAPAPDPNDTFQTHWNEMVATLDGTIFGRFRGICFGRHYWSCNQRSQTR